MLSAAGGKEGSSGTRVAAFGLSFTPRRSRDGGTLSEVRCHWGSRTLLIGLSALQRPRPFSPCPLPSRPTAGRLDSPANQPVSPTTGPAAEELSGADNWT